VKLVWRFVSQEGNFLSSGRNSDIHRYTTVDLQRWVMATPKTSHCLGTKREVNHAAYCDSNSSQASGCRDLGYF